MSLAELSFLLSLFQVVSEQLTVVRKAVSEGRKLQSAASPPIPKGLSMADLDGTVIFEHHPMEVILTLDCFRAMP